MGVPIVGVILSFSLILLVLSVLTLFFLPADAPAFTPAILSTAVNLITVACAALYLRRQSAKKRD